MDHTLTASEKVDLIIRLPLLFLPRMIFNCVRCSILAWWRKLPVKLYIAAGFLRTVLNSFSPRQIQFMNPTPIEAYKSWFDRKKAKAVQEGDLRSLHRLVFKEESLPDGKSSLLWVGNPETASKYILFFPGGGYIAPLSTGHFEWCYQACIGGQSDEEIAVALLQYTLCPAARYPTQLNQATAALRHLLESDIPAHKIIIGGDSAGGNLAAQLLIQLARSVTITEPLAGAFLVSPWLASKTSTRSFSDNEHIDMLSAGHVRASFREIIEKGKEHCRDGTYLNEWAMPADMDPKWLDGWWKVVKALYVTVGANEVLRDQSIWFAETVRYRNQTVKVLLEILETDAHDFALLEGLAMHLVRRKTEHIGSPRLARQRAVISSYFINS